MIRHARSGEVAARLGTESPVVVPANVYRTRDGGWVAVSGAGDQPFARLCEAIEAPEAPKDPRFATSAARLQNRAAADALVGDWIARHDQAEVEARFAAVGVAGTAVRSVDDIVADAHVKARQALLRLASTSGQAFLAPAVVPKLTRTPAADPPPAPRARRAHRGRARRDDGRADPAGGRGARGDGRRRPGRAPRARSLAVAGRPRRGRDPRRLRRRRDHGRAAARGRDLRHLDPHQPGHGGHQPQQAEPRARRARPARARGLPGAGARERRDRRELPPRHARALEARPRGAAGGEPAPGAAALLRVRADRALHRARGLQPGGPGLRRDHLSERLAGPAAAARRRDVRATTPPRSSTCSARWPRCCAATSTGRGRWSTPPCSRPRCA